MYKSEFEHAIVNYMGNQPRIVLFDGGLSGNLGKKDKKLES